MGRVFISHHHSDTIETLIRLIGDDLGHEVWSDQSLQAGEHFHERIRNEIKQAFCLVVVVSKAAIEDTDWIRQEVSWAEEAGAGIVPLFKGDLGPRPGWPEWVERLYLSRHVVRFGMNIGVDIQRQTAAGIRWIEAQPRGGKVVAFVNFKGGVGKTTLSALVALLFSESRSTLMVDLDPQANLTELYLDSPSLLAFAARDQTSLAMFEPVRLTRPQPEHMDYVPVDTIDFDPPTELVSSLPLPLRPDASRRLLLVPGDFRMVKFAGVGPGPYAQYRTSFVQVLNDLKQQYDLTVVDCGPAASLLSDCALSYADLIVAPVQPSVTSARGLLMMKRAAHDVFRSTIEQRIHPLFNLHVAGHVGERRFMDEFREDSGSAISENLAGMGRRSFSTVIRRADTLLRLDELLGRRRIDLDMSNDDIVSRLGVVGEPVRELTLELARKL